MLGNANFHRAHAVRDARLDLRRRGIDLYYLPHYGPELNDVERTCPTLDGLERAVDAAFTRCEAKLVSKHTNSPRKAAWAAGGPAAITTA